MVAAIGSTNTVVQKVQRLYNIQMEESAINNTRMENVMVMEFLNNMMDQHIMDSTIMDSEMVMGA